jgi:hypothetical protein
MARCDIAYADPTPALFSFNHPVGACPTCKGFGRTMAIDPELVIPRHLAAACRADHRIDLVHPPDHLRLTPPPFPFGRRQLFGFVGSRL